MAAVRHTAPAGIPVAGSLLDLRTDALGALDRARRDHGDLVRFTLGPRRFGAEVVCVFSAEGAQQVLAGDVATFRKDNVIYNEIRETFGYGLLTSQDDDHRRQRRLAQPLFTKRHTAGYAATFGVEATRLAATWRGERDGVVDLAAEIDAFIQRTACTVLFGGDADGAGEVIGRSFRTLGRYVVRRGFTLVRLPRGWPTPANRRAAAAQRDLRELCETVIARRSGRPASGADLLSRLEFTALDPDPRVDASGVTLATVGPLRCRISPAAG